MSQEDAPSLVYERDEQSVYLESKSGRRLIHSDVSSKEFAVISDIDDLLHVAPVLSDKLIHTIQHRQQLVRQNQYFRTLRTFQEKSGSYFEDCQRLQAVAHRSTSVVIDDHVDQLYKLDKFLKHYFRQLSVAQSLGFSEQLLVSYLSSNDYVYLYGFIRNACSALEYLGTLIENRLGSGTLELDDTSLTFEQVYLALQEQDLTATAEVDQEVVIPPGNERMAMGDLGLDSQEMTFLRQKRNEIVHHCPLVVTEETVENVPDALLTSAVLTQGTLDELTQIAARVHLHSVGMFLNLSKSYQRDMIETLCDAWEPESTPDTD